MTKKMLFACLFGTLLCSCDDDAQTAAARQKIQEERSTLRSNNVSAELTKSIQRFDLLSKCSAQYIEQHRLSKIEHSIPSLYIVICPRAVTATLWSEQPGKSQFERSAIAIDTEQQAWKTVVGASDEIGKSIAFPFAEISLYKREADNILLSIASKFDIHASCAVIRDSRPLLAINPSHPCDVSVKQDKFTITTSPVDSNIEILIAAANK